MDKARNYLDHFMLPPEGPAKGIRTIEIELLSWIAGPSNPAQITLR